MLNKIDQQYLQNNHLNIIQPIICCPELFKLILMNVGTDRFFTCHWKFSLSEFSRFGTETFVMTSIDEGDAPAVVNPTPSSDGMTQARALVQSLSKTGCSRTIPVSTPKWRRKSYI